MINAFNAAISAQGRRHRRLRRRQGRVRGADQAGDRRGIPVLAYNADGARRCEGADVVYRPGTLRIGLCMGQRIATMVPKGDIALFIATPGALNIQPRIDGAMARSSSPASPINPKIVATDADLSKELTAIDSYYLGHKKLAGMFAVDAGDTQGVGQIIQKHSLRGKGSRAVATTSCPARSSWSTKASWASRSTSSPTCRASSPCPALPLQAVRRPGAPSDTTRACCS